jgi:hypothetical protein
VIDTGLWGQWLIWISAAILTVWSMVYYLQKAMPEIRRRVQDGRRPPTWPGPDPLVRAMPAVFVLIWSTGFIVARYGMPHSPPLKFLAVRYALSSCASWSGRAGARRLAEGTRAVGATSPSPAS